MPRPAPAAFRRLPDLATPASAEPLAGFVERMLDRYPEYFPGATTRPTIAAIAEKGRRLSAVARVRLLVDGSPRGMYVKTHRKAGASFEHQRAKVLTEFNALGLLHGAFEPGSGLGVARPLAVFPDHLIVVTEEADGDNLHHLIRRGARAWAPRAAMSRLDNACEAAGRWLRQFQRITAAPDRRPVRSDVLLRLMRDDVRACVEMGLPETEGARMLAFCATHLREADAEGRPATGVHPDFQPDNVLVAAAGITVVDFASFQYGHAASDVARFLASLEFFSRTPLYPKDGLHRLMRAFLRGYGPRHPHDETMLAVYLVRFFARVAGSARTHGSTFPFGPLLRRHTIAVLSSWEQRLAAIRGLSVAC